MALTYRASSVSISFTFSRMSLEQVLFLIIMFIYGFFSTPTPDRIRMSEVIIGLLLIILFFLELPYFMAEIFKKKTFVSLLGIFFIFYFILFSSYYGLVFQQNSLVNFIRDFIPFLYFCMPLFLYKSIKSYPERWLKVLIAGLLIAGAGFIFQFIKGTPDIRHLIIQQWYGSNKDNPWQDPTTVYAFSYLGCLMIYGFLYRKLRLFLLSFFSYAIFFFVYTSTVSRASIALSFLTMIMTAWLITPRYKRWKRRILNVSLLFILAIIFVYLNYNLLTSAVTLLIQKTERVGISNARIIEMKAVIANIKSIKILLFGEGWGGLIANPIGGGAKWRFVHNMFFYYLFKTGFIGLAGVLVYMFWILKDSLEIMCKLNRFPWYFSLGFISIIPPLIVAGVLEASYKTLTFGVLLTLIIAYEFYFKAITDARSQQI